MHLAHAPYAGRFVSYPDVWELVDDFGTSHNDDDTSPFGGFEGRSTRRVMLQRDWQDPDFFRAECLKPDFHRFDEPLSFAHPIGLSIEVDVRIDFYVHPAWNEETAVPCFDRAAGARVEILSHTQWVAGEHVCAVALTASAMEEFCWNYLELERARDVAGVQA